MIYITHRTYRVLSPVYLWFKIPHVEITVILINYLVVLYTSQDIADEDTCSFVRADCRKIEEYNYRNIIATVIHIYQRLVV